MQSRTILVSLAAAALAFGCGTASAADGSVAAGKQKAAPCEACHGTDGNGIAPNYPALAGQYQDYLEHALHQYKDGQRTNAIMNGMAAPLSDQDIKDLTAFFSSLPSKLSDLHGKIQGGD
ncbi:MAG: Cytochrome c4 [Rhodanobacteraceae bacterium]|jgi:cytochrome c553|nr:MAG: Cytochrome c4 [Rhodanobacteraceae bacterium]